MSPAKELGDAAIERVKNPIVGAFGISFVLFNWQRFSHLFLSDSPVNVRLQTIDNLGFWIFWPIVTALAYVILMPWVSAGIERLRQFGTDKLIQVKKSQEPRLDLIEKINAKDLTLEDALSIVRPFDVIILQEAVGDFKSSFLAYSNSKQYLKPEERNKIEECVTEIDKAFQKFLGTPLDTPK